MSQIKYSTKRINWSGITWIILLIAAVIFYFVATGFIAFPQKYNIFLGLILLAIILLMGILSLTKSKRRRTSKKSIKQIITIVINCILSIALISASIYLPLLEMKMKGLFLDTNTETQEVRINAYVMTSTYKSSHTDMFHNTDTSTNLNDYVDAKFITQQQSDQNNQAYALEDIQAQLGINSLNVISKDDIWGALTSLYDGSEDVLILNEAYEASISEAPGYEKFTSDTQILYTTIKTIEVEKKEETIKNYTNTPFMVFIAGSDSRSASLSYYTRTDVDMLMTVDPVNKQVLLISIPRDWYVKNPALGNGYDKLTHLGNDGMQNTIDGLNQEFGFDYINNYFEVNFVTFYNIVDALGGITVNNPYAFISTSCEPVGNIACKSSYDFPAGEIQLDASDALAYVRERYHLSNGDYGRNEHQAIVLQAIIQELTSKEIIGSFNNLLNNLQGNFLTSMSSDAIYSLVQMQLNDGGSWKFVSYHLGGVGAHDVTASMGDMQLYVSYPISEQVDFAKEQMNKVMNGETINQEVLPSNDQTVYLPN